MAILLIFYEFALWIIAFAAVPHLLYTFFFKKKYRKNFFKRLGFGFPQITGQSIWLHAISVGETKALVPLAREIKKLFPDCLLIISSVTETGHSEAMRSLPFADYHVYLPFDFKWSIRKVLKKVSPELVIFCESDFWLNFLYYAKEQGAVNVLVNGKISQRSENRFRKVPFFSKRLFGLFEVLCVQNELYFNRFKNLGIPPEKIKITGNLKLDESYPQLTHQEILNWREKLGIHPDQLLLTIGSTHFPEEQLCLNVLKEIWREYPNLRVLIVPRHPERFKDVGNLLENEHISWISFTNINQRSGKEQVVLIDAMGLLRMCYQLSDMAIVAGSFTNKVGGHNILEPSAYGKPVLFGPYMHTQLELVDLMEKYRAGIQVTENELGPSLERWIRHPEERQAFGQNGLTLMKELKGSTQKTLNFLSPIFEKICKKEK